MLARRAIYNTLGFVADRLTQRGQQRTATRTPGRTTRTARKSYSAGSVSRLTSDWNISDKSADEAIHPNLTRMRGRSRDLARNNDYAKRYFNLLKTNVIGHQGIRLQVRAKNKKGKFDKKANRLIEKAWKEWGKVGSCTTCGLFSWLDVQNLIIEAVGRDGEILVKMVGGWTGNKFGFAIQLIEAENLDADKNANLPGNISIRMGVQRDSYKRVTHYWIKQADGTSKPEPAADILHIYRPDRAGQSRGVPETAAPATRLKQIDAHEEAHVVASRIGASKMGFFTSKNGAEYGGEDDDETEDDELIMEAEPGTFEQLPKDVEFQSWDPQYPVATFADFESAVLRGIASGLNVSYVTLANDLKGVSYSSIRQGELSDRDFWRVLQTWMIEHVCQLIFEEWIKWALLHNAVDLPYSGIEQYKATAWRPRGWAWIDPLKESKASENDSKNQFKAIQEIAAERGYDFEEILEDTRRAKELAKEYGVVIPSLTTEELKPANQPRK